MSRVWGADCLSRSLSLPVSLCRCLSLSLFRCVCVSLSLSLSSPRDFRWSLVAHCPPALVDLAHSLTPLDRCRLPDVADCSCFLFTLIHTDPRRHSARSWQHCSSLSSKRSPTTSTTSSCLCCSTAPLCFWHEEGRLNESHRKSK